MQYTAWCFLDRLDRRRAALALADHADQAGLRQHRLDELVHARGRRRAGGTDHLVAHRVDRADVVDEAVGEIDRAASRRSPACPAMRLCAASRPVRSLPESSRRVARLPGRDFLARERVEINAPAGGRVERELRPVGERGRLELGRRRCRRARSARGASPRSSAAAPPACDAACVGNSLTLTSSTVDRPPRPWAPMPSAFTFS